MNGSLSFGHEGIHSNKQAEGVQNWGAAPELITLVNKGHIKTVQASVSENCLVGDPAKQYAMASHVINWTRSTTTSTQEKAGYVKIPGNKIPRQGKLLLANGLIIGKLNYLLTIYGGTQEKYLQKLQVIQNNTDCFITGAVRRTSTLSLMKSVNWLTIKDMVAYHTLIAGWKVIKLSTPHHLVAKFKIHQDNTVSTDIPRLMNTTLTLRYRILECTGAYGPLLLAPAKGLGGPLGPLTCGGNLF